MEFYSVDSIAEKLIGGTLDARRMRVIRALEAGAFPTARKVNPERETSPWVIPTEEAEAWLDETK